jgi:hypothetical protein
VKDGGNQSMECWGWCGKLPFLSSSSGWVGCQWVLSVMWLHFECFESQLSSGDFECSELMFSCGCENVNRVRMDVKMWMVLHYLSCILCWFCNFSEMGWFLFSFWSRF